MQYVLCRRSLRHDGRGARGHVERLAVHHRADGFQIALGLCRAEFSVEQPSRKFREADPLIRRAPLCLGVKMIWQRDDRSHNDIIASPDLYRANQDGRYFPRETVTIESL